VLFEVVDTGIGIPEDRQAAIFEKFTQADGSTTRRYGGTGLGLSISQSLVELQGGVIGVESAGMGLGTRMYFSLPVWRTDAEFAEPAESIDGPAPEVISGPPGGPLILIVEDDSVFRLFVVSLLQQHGYRTAVASHAEAGWLLARKLRPSLVLLDYALSCPEGAVLRTGWDLAERMASDPKTRRIPFVFVTGFEGELHDKLKNVTFVRQPRHLPKPVESKRLLGQVNEALGGAPVDIVRVLLADDDPTVVAFVTKVLGEERFQIDVVNNGEECLHLLRTHPRAFDLLLLDLMMPDVSGYDVLREMALSGVAAKLPVIVLTNYPDARNEDERRLLEEGIVLDILAKADVHERPDMLPFVINHHLLGHGSSTSPGVTPLEVERFQMQVPAGDASTEDGLALERFERAPRAASPGVPPRDEGRRRAA
jgi:CheY-like chemotaxis protein